MKNSKNILHITNNDYDGAGRAVSRLNENLNNIGIKSNVLVLYKKSNNNKIISLGTGMTFKEIFLYILKKKFLCNYKFYNDLVNKFIFRITKIIFIKIYNPKNLYNFNKSIYSLDKFKPYLKNVDVIVLHSIQEIISTKDILDIYKISGIKIIFHPLDMEMLTGGYHFSYDCHCYKTGKCNSQKHNMNKISEKAYHLKIDLLNKIPITWVATNNFILNRIRNSKIFSNNHNIETVFLSIDKNLYKSYSKKESRNILNIDVNKKIILFGCFDFMDLRKGSFILKKITKSLDNYKYKDNKIMIATYGELNGFKICNDFIEWRHFGLINSSTTMNYLYRSSDIMINPSLDDMGPTTFQEAFLNNLYVVSFNMGLAKDLIFENINGNIISNFDVDQFVNRTINKLINDNKNEHEYAENINITKMKQFCSHDYEAKHFLKIFN